MSNAIDELVRRLDEALDDFPECRGITIPSVCAAVAEQWHIEQTLTLSQKYEQLREAVGNLACRQCGFRISDGHAWICMACRPVRALLAIPGRGEFAAIETRPTGAGT